MRPVPTRVKIGPWRWRVSTRPADHVEAEKTLGYRVYGATLIGKQLIVIDPSTEGDDCVTVTFAHELLHALFASTGTDKLLGNTDEDLEEQLIQNISPALVQVLRENPKVVEYLRGRS